MLPCPTVHDDSDSDDVLQLLDAEENVSSVDYKVCCNFDEQFIGRVSERKWGILGLNPSLPLNA